MTASSSNPDATVKVSIDADYQGEVTFKAPSFSDGSAVTVTLNVNDPVNKRETTATTSVNVTESDPLTLTISSDIKSVSVRAGGKVSIPFTVGGATTKVPLRFQPTMAGALLQRLKMITKPERLFLPLRQVSGLQSRLILL